MAHIIKRHWGSHVRHARRVRSHLTGASSGVFFPPQAPPQAFMAALLFWPPPPSLNIILISTSHPPPPQLIFPCAYFLLQHQSSPSQPRCFEQPSAASPNHFEEVGILFLVLMVVVKIESFGRWVCVGCIRCSCKQSSFLPWHRVRRILSSPGSPSSTATVGKTFVPLPSSSDYFQFWFLFWLSAWCLWLTLDVRIFLLMLRSD